MTRTIVGVLRGGTSSEYDLSLKTGAAILSALPEDQYETRDILVDKQGMWHVRGIPADPARALAQVDVVLNALHGGVGEDGTVGRIITRMGIPYAGSTPHASALALNKIRARQVLQGAGIRMPHGVSFTLDTHLNTAEMAMAVFNQFAPPYMVKPPSDGASYGIRMAGSIVELPDMIADCLDVYGSVLVEEFVRGHDVSVGVVEGFRNEDLYALPPAHMIVPDAMSTDRKGSRFIHSALHRDQNLIHRVPSGFSFEDKESLTDVARRAHNILELSHFSRADFVLTPRGPYLLEVNAIPGLYPGASFPLMLESVGSSTREFLEHAIGLAKGATRRL